MKYYFSDDYVDKKKCPVCREIYIGNNRLLCDNCRQVFEESENNLNAIDWVNYNVWRRRLRFLPFGKKIVEEFKIYKL